MTGFVEQLRTYFDGLEPGQRRVLVAAVLLSLALIIGVGAFSYSDRYVTIYSSRSAADVQDVKAALEAQGVDYRIAADGLSIEVLPQFEGQARIAGASAGMMPFRPWVIVCTIASGVPPWIQSPSVRFG